jgi:hypothetical protein
MNALELETLLPHERILSWSQLLSRSYGLYAERFGTYFQIALAPTLAACAFSYLEPMLGRRLFHLVPVFSAKWVVLSFVIGWTRGAVYWTISTFFFAAIAATFSAVQAADTPAITDAFTLPRKRLGAVVSFALLTWTLFFIGRTLAGFAVTEILSHMGFDRSYWVLFSGLGLMLVLVAGLLSRFGLAIPELMCDLSASVGDAVRKSIRSTEGREIFFIAFLFKAAILGFCANWLTNHGLDWIWNQWQLSWTAYFWIQGIIYVCIAAALESPLFIAFSVLYSELQARAEKSTGVSPA